MYDNMSRVIEVDIDEILPNRFQPRIQFDEEEILELSDSIKEHGIIQPIVVRTIGDKYEIIAGERRYKASVLAGKETVPVIVRNLNDKDSAEIALIENVQRKNLTPIEEAISYKKILDMGYLTQENLAKKLGKSQSSIANKIRLLNLSDEAQESLLENKISERHARSLLKLNSLDKQNKMLERIINERLTVRRTDEEIDKIKEDDESSDSQKVIEEGEINMNNSIFGMPNIPETPQPNAQSFDIFASNNNMAQPVQEQTQPTSIPNFDMFGTNTSTVPEANAQPIPSTEPQSQNIFDNSNVNNTVPSVDNSFINPFNTQPETTSQPLFRTAPAMPTMNAMEFNSDESVVPSPTIDSLPTQQQISVPEVNPVPETNFNTNPVPSFDIPQMAPIAESPMPQQTNFNSSIPTVEQQSDNMFGFQPIQEPQQTSPVPDVQSQPEFKMPEPIIVTDYSKQYDPVMPQTVETVTPHVEFREVINAIRECSKKIEQYGFKIDVEEYDLANLYQVVFKVEK